MPHLPYPIDWAKTGQLTVFLICYAAFLYAVGRLLEKHSPAHWPEWKPTWKPPQSPAEPSEAKRSYPAIVADDEDLHDAA